MFEFYKKFSQICGDSFEKCNFNPEENLLKQSFQNNTNIQEKDNQYENRNSQKQTKNSVSIVILLIEGRVH